MGEAFIVRRGGSGKAKLFAAIGVIYPAGYVCTCTDGSKNIAGVGADGQCVFAVPYEGKWTVSCSNGKTQEVLITAEGQNVLINWQQFVLFAGGSGLAKNYSGISLPNGDNTVSSSAITMVSSNTQREIFYISPAIDCSSFSKITVKGQQTGAGSAASTLTVGVVESIPTGTSDSPAFVKSAVFDIAKPNTEQTLTVDLSSVSGNCYFAICGYFMAPGFVNSIVFE